MTAEFGVKWLLRFISVTTLPAFTAVSPDQRTGFFWAVFVDFAESLAQAILLLYLLLRLHSGLTMVELGSPLATAIGRDLSHSAVDRWLTLRDHPG